MAITALRLRADICRILDEVLASGRAVEIERRGRKLRIVPERAGDRLAGLRKRKLFRGKVEDIIGLDWSKYWSGGDDAH